MACLALHFKEENFEKENLLKRNLDEAFQMEAYFVDGTYRGILKVEASDWEMASSSDCS